MRKILWVSMPLVGLLLGGAMVTAQEQSPKAPSPQMHGTGSMMGMGGHGGHTGQMGDMGSMMQMMQGMTPMMDGCTQMMGGTASPAPDAKK